VQEYVYNAVKAIERRNKNAYLSRKNVYNTKQAKAIIKKPVIKNIFKNISLFLLLL
jgi:hypothetical protein